MMAHADVPVCTGGGLALPAVLTLDNGPHTVPCCCPLTLEAAKIW